MALGASLTADSSQILKEPTHGLTHGDSPAALLTAGSNPAAYLLGEGKDKKMKTYKGHSIYECERVKGEHAGKWIIQDYHHTGIPYADELCPHFHSLKAAKDYISEARVP